MTRHLGFLTASLACALLALGLALPAAGAATTDEGALSAGLEGLQEAAESGITSPAALSEAASLPGEGPGSLIRDGGNVIVEAHFEAGALARLEALEAAGAKVLMASRRYQTVSLSVAPEDLSAIAEVPGLSSVAPSREPTVYNAEETLGTRAVQSNGLCEGGSVISQGVEQLRVPAARAAFGARGKGETIGVISDSFNGATEAIGGGPVHTKAHEDEVSNDLPGPASTCSGQQTRVDVVAEAPAPAAGESLTDEGRAMLQVVHDLAPHAQLAFATAYSTELEFARNIERLAEPVSAGGAGADVIVDDVGYFTEPFYQDGPVAVAIKKVTEAGVTYLTAAGNENIKDSSGHNIGSWEAPAYRSTACPEALKKADPGASNSCMNFKLSGAARSEFGIAVANGGEVAIDMQWAEPWFGVETDLDAYLFSSTGALLAESVVDSIEEEIPVELLGWKNETGKGQEVFLVINRCSGSCNPQATPGTPRLKFEFVGHGGGVTETEFPTTEEVGGVKDVVGPTIYGHAASAAAISVGAIRYTESASAPKEPEPYSSRGPVTLYFGPVTSTTPAAELTTPEELEKPDLTATDCASTTFFARLESGAYHFCGTSEAAPHAAAVAALMKQTEPLASPAAVLAAMQSSATLYTPVNANNGPTAVGAGLLNAAGALSALGGSPVDDPPSSIVASLEPEAVPAAVSPAPTVTITKGPKSPGKESRPTFEFSSTRPATFTCQVDGGTPQSCSSPYLLPGKLADGPHGFAVTGTDAQGRSGSSGVYSFTIDTKAPLTTIVRHPKKVVRTRMRSVVGRFKLRSDEAPVTFYCQVDREALRVCGPTFQRHFTPGVHVLKVRAMDAAGNIASGWTRYRFRVKQVGRR